MAEHKKELKEIESLKKYADDIISYYKIFSKDGIIGAGEFMQAAATWNYDPKKRRPYQNGRIPK